MVLNTFLRVSGFVAILAGILNVLSGLPDLFPESTLTLIRRFADIGSLIALVGIYLYQRKQLDVFGQVGFFCRPGGRIDADLRLQV
jgi:hypothetical protein